MEFRIACAVGVLLSVAFATSLSVQASARTIKTGVNEPLTSAFALLLLGGARR